MYYLLFPIAIWIIAVLLIFIRFSKKPREALSLPDGRYRRCHESMCHENMAKHLPHIWVFDQKGRRFKIKNLKHDLFSVETNREGKKIVLPLQA